MHMQDMPSETAAIVQLVELPSAELIFGISAGMRDIRQKIECALQDDLPVLIEGESGTGKEVIARYVHHHSSRREGPFLKLSCAALPVNLIEQEMFGGGRSPESGAKSGSIALAAGGTLFLDEVADLGLGVQEKLANILGSGHYGTANGAEDPAISTRFICATSRILEKAAEAGQVSADLLRRVAHHRLHLLPLRERKEDIPQLCEYLLGKYAREFRRPLPVLSSNVLSVFQQWKWPGNIRELENWIARIVIFGTEEAIGLEFSRQLLAWQESFPRTHRATRLTLNRTRRIRPHR